MQDRGRVNGFAPLELLRLDSHGIMVVMKIEKEYDRHSYEVQQQGENGKWYRLVSSDRIENGNDKEMVQIALENAAKQISWARAMKTLKKS